MKIWDAATGREMSTFSFTTTGRNAPYIAISSDSRSVVTVEGALQFWRLPEGTLERSVPLNTVPTALLIPAFSPDGKGEEPDRVRS